MNRQECATALDCAVDTSPEMLTERSSNQSRKLKAPSASVNWLSRSVAGGFTVFCKWLRKSSGVSRIFALAKLEPSTENLWSSREWV